MISFYNNSNYEDLFERMYYIQNYQFIIDYHVTNYYIIFLN